MALARGGHRIPNQRKFGPEGRIPSVLGPAGRIFVTLGSYGPLPGPLFPGPDTFVQPQVVRYADRRTPQADACTKDKQFREKEANVSAIRLGTDVQQLKQQYYSVEVDCLEALTR